MASHVPLIVTALSVEFGSISLATCNLLLNCTVKTIKLNHVEANKAVLSFQIDIEIKHVFVIIFVTCMYCTICTEVNRSTKQPIAICLKDFQFQSVIK